MKEEILLVEVLGRANGKVKVSSRTRRGNPEKSKKVNHRGESGTQRELLLIVLAVRLQAVQRPSGEFSGSSAGW